MSGKNSVYNVILSPRAVKQLKEMAKQDQERVRKALSGLTSIPPQGDIKKLKGFKGRFRLRVGDWRIIFVFNVQEKKVLISEILPRSDAYKT